MKKSAPSTCSQELAALHWDCTAQGRSKLNALSKMTPSVSEFCDTTGLTHASMTMSAPSTLEPLEESTSLPVGSHARTFHLPVTAKDLRVTDQDCGASSTELLANYDPDTSSWRTSQRCFIEGWARFSQTWPRSGMMRNGTAYRLPTLAEAISATGCSSFPTPTARDYKGSRSLASQQKTGRGAANSLPDYLRVNGNWQYPPVAVVESMMGFPDGWTSCEVLETAFMCRSSPQSDKQSLKDGSDDLS